MSSLNSSQRQLQSGWRGNSSRSSSNWGQNQKNNYPQQQHRTETRQFNQSYFSKEGKPLSISLFAGKTVNACSLVSFPCESTINQTLTNKTCNVVYLSAQDLQILLPLLMTGHLIKQVTATIIGTIKGSRALREPEAVFNLEKIMTAIPLIPSLPIYPNIPKYGSNPAKPSGKTQRRRIEQLALPKWTTDALGLREIGQRRIELVILSWRGLVTTDFLGLNQTDRRKIELAISKQ